MKQCSQYIIPAPKRLYSSEKTQKYVSIEDGLLADLEDFKMISVWPSLINKAYLKYKYTITCINLLFLEQQSQEDRKITVLTALPLESRAVFGTP